MHGWKIMIISLFRTRCFKGTMFIVMSQRAPPSSQHPAIRNQNRVSDGAAEGEQKGNGREARKCCLTGSSLLLFISVMLARRDKVEAAAEG